MQIIKLQPAENPNHPVRLFDNINKIKRKDTQGISRLICQFLFCLFNIGIKNNSSIANHIPAMLLLGKKVGSNTFISIITNHGFKIGQAKINWLQLLCCFTVSFITSRIYYIPGFTKEMRYAIRKFFFSIPDFKNIFPPGDFVKTFCTLCFAVVYKYHFRKFHFL